MTDRVKTSALALIAFSFLLIQGCSSPKPPDKGERARVEVPDVFRVNFESTKGAFVIEVTKAWAPEGAERFYLLARRGFYDGARFYRVLPRFIVQFGINGDPELQSRWRDAFIPDDPVKQSNARGTVAFAKSGPNTRTTQIFVNMADNKRLDKDGFAPFGKVVRGMEVFGRLYSAYGETAPAGNGPNQELIETQGNAYLERQFPRLDHIRSVRIVPGEDGAVTAR